MSGLARLLLIAFILLGGGAAVVLYGGSGEAKAPPERMHEIRVAAADLPVGTFLDPTDAPFESTPQSRVRDEYISADEPDVLGAVIIAPIRKGDPVVRSALLTPGQEGFLAAVLKPGARAVSVGVDAVSGNAGLIFPGDRVDVLLTLELDAETSGEDPGRSWGAETILRNARVIAVDQNLKTDLAERDPSKVARTITLEVAPEEAERIAVARNLGALSLTLRSLIVENDADPLAALGDAGAESVSPTWAGDVSAVIRAVTGRPVAPPPPVASPTPPPPVASAAPVAEAPPPAPAPTMADAPARPIRVMRGAASATVDEDAP